MAIKRINKFLSAAHYQEEEKKCLEKLAKSKFAGKKVLDIGCGTGKYMELFKKYGCEVTGVDVNPKQVADLCVKGYRTYLPEELPADETWDVVLMSHVIEHMPPDKLVASFENLFPKLNKDGRLIVIAPLLGERFYYDFTHERPYYPQSLWMLFGNMECPASYKSQWRLELDDIHFFRDPVRLRGNRYYYPCVAKHEPAWKFSLFSSLITGINVMLTLCHKFAPGLLGVRASWMGIYKISGVVK